MIGRHLLTIDQLTTDDIEHIFSVARDMRERLDSSRKKRDDLHGRAVIYFMKTAPVPGPPLNWRPST